MHGPASRRAFARRVFGAAVPVALLGIDAAAQSGTLTGISASPADSLSLYIDLLHRTEIELLKRESDAWTTSTGRVTDAVQQLSSTVDRLERALAATGR